MSWICQAYCEELAREINPHAEAYARQTTLYAYNRWRGDERSGGE